MCITNAEIAAYAAHLHAEERGPGTIVKYAHDLTALARFLDGKPLTHESTAAWKVHLLEQEHKPNTVNAMLAAVNGFCRFFDLPVRVKFLKLQRQIFRDSSRELTKEEYDRLLTAARESGQERLALIMETLCATGVRVSEVKFLTVEAAKAGRTDIRLKGKIRTILLPKKLCKKLIAYAKAQKIPCRDHISRQGIHVFKAHAREF